MADEGLVLSPKEESRRKVAIQKLEQIVSSDHQISVTSATVRTYGSYGLGVHSPESDIDAFCVAPFFASMAEDFFVCLHDMLQKRLEVSEMHCVKGAKVHLMRFKFDGISMDLPYARLKVQYVSKTLNPVFVRKIDGTSKKSLSGVRASKHILHLVSNVENVLLIDLGKKNFQSMLRFLKLLAKRKGVYGTLEKNQGFCDPNPTEYVNAEKTEPDAVFYWGFLNGKDNVTDKIQLLVKEFMSNLSTHHDVFSGKMELSILLASELPKNAVSDDDISMPTKTCWKKTTDL